MKVFEFFYQPRLGALVLRVSLSLMLLLHGYSKLMHGAGAIEGMLAKAGLPAFLAYGVYIGEVVAPLLLLAGPFIVPAALVVAFNMLVAIYLAHTSQFFTLSKSGGWALELQAFFFVSALVIALTTPAGTKASAVHKV